jgi:hypothetical protein
MFSSILKFQRSSTQCNDAKPGRLEETVYVQRLSTRHLRIRRIAGLAPQLRCLVKRDGKVDYPAGARGARHLRLRPRSSPLSTTRRLGLIALLLMVFASGLASAGFHPCCDYLVPLARL